MGRLSRVPGWSAEAQAEAALDCWKRAGIDEGMRLLNVGCGPGEVTFALANLVGASGSVMGVDADQDAVRRARRKADEECRENVEFSQTDSPDDSLLGLPPFDGLVGSLYLVRQSDPALALRRLARLVSPGGIVAFLEPELEFGYHAQPPAPLLEDILEWIQASCRETGTQMHAASSLPRFFLEAGLAWPQMRAYQCGRARAVSTGQGLVEAIQDVIPAVGRSARSRAQALGFTGSTQEQLTVALDKEGVTVAAPLAGAWARVA